MRRTNDQIFQLSLTEIAFTLAFILLLLLGYMVLQADERNRQLERALTEVGDVSAERQALESARTTLMQELSAHSVKPDEIMSSLVSEAKLIQERDALKKRVEDLDAHLSALTEVKNTLKATEGGQGASETVRADVTDALALKAELQKEMLEQLKQPYAPGQSAVLAKELISAVKLARDGEKTFKDLRGQIKNLEARLQARGGRDYPPCWANEETGKVEYLFTIEITPEGLRITPAWPESRQADAAALPGVDKLTMASPLSLNEFDAVMQGIDRVSKAKECRHYVYLKNRVKDLDTFNRYRYGIENFFYKLELRS